MRETARRVGVSWCGCQLGWILCGRRRHRGLVHIRIRWFGGVGHARKDTRGTRAVGEQGVLMDMEGVWELDRKNQKGRQSSEALVACDRGGGAPTLRGWIDPVL